MESAIMKQRWNTNYKYLRLFAIQTILWAMGTTPNTLTPYSSHTCTLLVTHIYLTDFSAVLMAYTGFWTKGWTYPVPGVCVCVSHAGIVPFAECSWSVLNVALSRKRAACSRHQSVTHRLNLLCGGGVGEVFPANPAPVATVDTAQQTQPRHRRAWHPVGGASPLQCAGDWWLGQGRGRGNGTSASSKSGAATRCCNCSNSVTVLLRLLLWCSYINEFQGNLTNLTVFFN